jgi:hypothetical protein
MGPWDIMSQHFINYFLPPPGISSFTKIRLGWISRHQVNFVMPGQTRFVSLSPLSKNGDILAIKVPLSSGHYYLIENRQPVGFDEVLPDSGILILKVNPEAQEGSGTVRVINANSDYPYFSQAAFRLDRRESNIFVDKKHNVSVIPLWSEGENQNVLVTTPEESTNALKSALLIQKLLDFYPEPWSKEQDHLIKKCIRAFKNFDFKTCCQLTEDIFK